MMMMKEPVTRTRTKVYHHNYDTTLRHVEPSQFLLKKAEVTKSVVVDETKQKQEYQVTMKMKVECNLFTSNRIEKVLKDFKDFKHNEMLQKSVENRLALKHGILLGSIANSNEFDEKKRYKMDVELKVNKSLEDILKNLTKDMFEEKIESHLPDVLDCHLKSIREKQEVNYTRYDSSSATLRRTDWHLLAFIELSILLFVLNRKLYPLYHLNPKTEEEAFDQQKKESHRLLSKPQVDVVVDVPPNKERIIVQTKPAIQNPNDCVLTSTTKVVFRDKKEKARSEMAVPIPTQVVSVPNKPKEPIPDRLFVKVKEPARTKDFCHALCFIVAVLIVLAGIGFGLFFLVTFKW